MIAANRREVHVAGSMLTETQLGVLVALNDLCELEDKVLLDHESGPPPDRLRDLGCPDTQIYKAVADLHQLGLIDGVTVAQRNYPSRIQGLTAYGRQAIPSG